MASQFVSSYSPISWHSLLFHFHLLTLGISVCPFFGLNPIQMPFFFMSPLLLCTFIWPFTN